MKKPAAGRTNPDPVFQAEMTAVLEERRRAFVGDFRERWAEVASRPVTPIHTSTIHRHKASCFGEDQPEVARENGVGDFLVGRVCSRTNAFVTRTVVPMAEGRRLGLYHHHPVPEGRVP